MTIQMNPAAPQLVMLLLVVATIVLITWIAFRAVRSRPVRVLAACAGGLVALYAMALVGVSLAGGTENLRPGDVKCFDEWCARMVSAQRGGTPSALVVQVDLSNRGRNAQKSVLARAFIEAGSKRVWPQNPDDLHVLVSPAGSLEVNLRFVLPAQFGVQRFVVTEAASGTLTPGVVVIGDESSPWHSIAGWYVGSD